MKKKWTILAFEPRAHIFPTILYWSGVLRSSDIIKVPVEKMAFLYKDHTLTEAVKTRTLIKLGEEILKLLKKNDEFLKRIIKENRRQIPLVLKSAEKLKKLNLKKLSDKQLIKLWQDYTENFISLMGWSAMGTILEYEYPILTKELEKILKQRNVGFKSFGQHMSILTTPSTKTISQQEVIDLLKIRLLPKKTWDTKLTNHRNKYYWIAFGYDGPGWSLEDIKKRFNSLPTKKADIQKMLKEEIDRGKDLEKSQKDLAKKLKLDRFEARMFHALRTLGYWKFQRKFMLQKSQGLAENFLKEIASRQGLSIPQVKMLAPWEVETLLLRNKPKVDELNQRIELSVVLMILKKIEILTGKEAQKIEKEILEAQKVNKNIKKFPGDIAYPGEVTGTVKKIEEAKEMDKFNKGDILVSSTTNPELIPAMKKAAAIITDAGGITSHAAIVSRELKTPCIIGTKIATKVLEDGDLVKVDANKGIVIKIKK